MTPAFKETETASVAGETKGPDQAFTVSQNTERGEVVVCRSATSANHVSRLTGPKRLLLQVRV